MNTQAILLRQCGGPEQLRLESVALDAPGPGEVQIRHTAIGLNFIDIYHRTGLYPLPKLPSGIGLEAAGVVLAVGPGVTGFSVGDRVAYCAGPPGAYAEARNHAAGALVRLPGDISDDVAAAILLKGMTAEYLLRRCCRVTAGDTILFHAAAGGVGLIACQWAKALGARVIGTVSTEEKAVLARAHGCDEVVVTSASDFAPVVRELTAGRGADVVYDSVGQATFDGSLSCLKPRGTLVLFGQSSGKVPPFDLGRLGGDKSHFVTRPSLGAYVATRDELLACAAALFEVVAKGAVRVPAPRVVALADVAQAHRDLESRKTTGSTVLALR